MGTLFLERAYISSVSVNIWALTQENLTLLHAKNKVEDQPAPSHQCLSFLLIVKINI